MPASKGTNTRKGGLNVDTALVRELADILAETGLTEIEVEDDDRKIRVAREIPASSGANLTPAQIAAFGMLRNDGAPTDPSPSPAPAATTDAPTETAAVDHANAIKSPMVGTAYLAPEPGSANFVNVGDEVKKGDTLLIVEAMKVMNPITAPTDGTVKDLLIGNGEPVEFDQPLAIVE